MDIVDLRSDTVTKPSLVMREAMQNANVGDDVFREDPTIRELEERVANMFLKESALFFPSGTMCNLAAILSWCSQRGSEMIVGDNSHIFLFEQASAAQFGGVSPRTVPNLENGTMDLTEIGKAIRDNDIHEPVTKLICIENTHNACGGKVLPMTFLQDLKSLANTYNIPIHMDGARIWNAITALKIEPYEIGCYVHSLSVCLSKGLGAPAGSLLVGSNELITKARRIRKALGGGMRQVGVLGAAGLVALNDFDSGILQNDHILSKILANSIRELPAFQVSDIETNIIFVNIVQPDKYLDCGEHNSSKIAKMLKNKGILVSAWAPSLFRIVVHRDIRISHIYQTIMAFKEISDTLISNN